MGSMVTFPSNGETAGGYLARAAAGGAPRGVLVIQEWWGLDGHIRSVADRFASAGFVALAPDLYHGRVTTSPDEAGRLLMDLDIERAERDLRGAVAHLRALTGKPVGSVGFCMGGALSLFAACKAGTSIAACVVYYGGYRKVEYDFDGLTAPILGHWAEDDPSVNERLPALEAELKKRGKAYAFHHYPGTRHAFFNDERPSHHRDAAEESWRRTVAFFAAHL